MIRTITISGEYGSGGSALAESVAGRLGWKFWDAELTQQIADLAKCDPVEVERREERTDPLLYRIFKAFLRGGLESPERIEELEMLDTDRILELSERVVREASECGHCVIVGRSSAWFLRNLPGALHVFVHAPFEEKVRNLREIGIKENEAVDLVSTIDRKRAEFIKRYFGAKWPDRRLYQLVINMKIGAVAAVDTVLRAVAELNKRAASAAS